MAGIPIFPFTAVVGQEQMRRSLILNAVSQRIGGVLIRGERGTAKSTAARALAALLPEIEVVSDCPYNCEPSGLDGMCDNCRERLERGEELPRVQRRTGFIDLPVSATEDRVVGMLDIEKAIQKGERHFEPGVLAAANRGLLYVDEVNLLDDHVVDLLLDSAAMGVNVVEREGISFSHPAQFMLVGTMNPEEGDLRPQLLDRFALCVDIRGITDPDQRAQILERRIQYEQDPAGFSHVWQPHEEQLSQEIVQARDRLPLVKYEERDLYTIAQLTSEFRVDGHRADIVILKTALAQAAFVGRLHVTDEDILLAAELALPHRMKRQPFQEAALDADRLENRLQQIRVEQAAMMSKQSEPGESDASEVKKNEVTEGAEALEDGSAATAAPDESANSHGQESDSGKSSEKPVSIGDGLEVRRLDTPLDRLSRQNTGKRSVTRTERKRGRYIKARPANGEKHDIAFDATIRQAAPHQVKRRTESPSNLAFLVSESDLQRKIRVRRTSNLVLFAVDASWSMAAAERMEATKGAILSLLVDAYQRRDHVGLIVFQRDKARVVLPPTNSVELAERALRELPVGGKTPLSSGLLLSFRLCTAAQRRDPEVIPLIILLTDGAGNVSMTGLPAQEEALKIADLIRTRHFRSAVINMEHAAFDRGLARGLAEAMGAPCYSLPELHADSLVRTVKDQLDS